MKQVPNRQWIIIAKMINTMNTTKIGIIQTSMQAD